MAKRQMFTAGAFDDLRAASGETTGAPLRLALTSIDEDPDQPRQTFNEAALTQFASSIRMVGVLQPIGVVQQPGGRYLLRWGARRLRASKIAEQADIPAVLVGPEQAGLESQVIENAHRAPNSDSELAAAIDRLTERGMKNVEIATVLALPDPQWIKHYRVVGELQGVPALAALVDAVPVRTLYELFRAWQKATPAQRASLADALAGVDELTLAAARRLIEAHVVTDEATPASQDGAKPVPMVQTAPGLNDASRATQAVPMVQPEPMPQADPKESKLVPMVQTEPASEPGPDELEGGDDPDAARVVKVRAWLKDTTRPRPKLTV